MHWTTYSTLAIASHGLGVHGQLAYGSNHVDVIRDSDLVARAFPDVQDIELLSPAFTEPESVLPGFSNGTAPPTSLKVLGKFFRCRE